MFLRHFSSSSIPAATARRKLLEVETKFTYLPRLLPAFTQNAGRPPFKSLTHIKTSKFRDTYYDDIYGTLFHKRIYIRKRDTTWECKSAVIPSSSTGSGSKESFNKVTYDETNDISLISKIISEHIPTRTTNTSEGKEGEENFGLTPYCDITTHRQTFKADDKFSIMLDETDFRHYAGEVELLVEGGGESVVVKARGQIEEFMEEYRWFFKPMMGRITYDDGKSVEPKGKMTAYFERFGRPFTKRR